MQPDDEGALPLAVQGFLRESSDRLARRETKCVRLYPLVLRHPIEELIRRRSRIFASCTAREGRHGWEVMFATHVRATRAWPDGREVRGVFHLLPAGPDTCIVTSSLDAETDRRGPWEFAKRAYPIALRPFVTSQVLQQLVRRMEQVYDLTAVSTDVCGYDVGSRRLRRDWKLQPLDDAAREMAEQHRHLHRALISFADREAREILRVTVDRYGTATVLAGDALRVANDYVLAALRWSASERAKLYVGRALRHAEQMALRMSFEREAFHDYDAMRALCDVVRRPAGLGVTVVHLNPYLQAQVLDFLTGASVELVVMGPRDIHLLPRSGDCGVTLDRIASAVCQFYGEAVLERVSIGSV